MKALTTSAIAVIATGFAMAPTAHAATDFGFKYSYDAEKLETQAGAEEVLSDLTKEISEHCESTFTSTRLTNWVLARQCTSRTLEATVTKINSPMLSKVYAETKA